jgi:hypothetical protein
MAAFARTLAYRGQFMLTRTYCESHAISSLTSGTTG